MKRTPLRRKTPMRRKPMRRRVRSTTYSRRTRNREFMLWVKTLPCATWTIPMPWYAAGRTPCSEVVEADHLGERGMQQKAADETCGPLCTNHHRERTDFLGMFWRATKETMREWVAAVIADTQRRWSVRANS